MATQKVEGGPVSQLRGLIKNIGRNTDTDIEYATVVSASPLVIQPDNAKITLDEDDVVIPQHLSRWTEKVSVNAQAITLLMSQYTRTTKKTASSSTSTDTTFSDQITGTFEIAQFDIEHHNELQTGDRVILASAGEGQRYFVIDRIVTEVS